MTYKIINGILCLPKNDDIAILRTTFFVVDNKIRFNFNGKHDKTIDAKGGIILPGLVNAHNHIYSTLSKGLPVKGKFKDFEGILKNLWWKLDSVLDENETVLSTLISIKESFENGVTTMFDHHISMKFIEKSLSTMSDLFEKYNMQGGLAFETTNRYGKEIRDRIIKENIDFYKSAGKTKALFGMHALLTLNEKDLYEISGKIPSNMPIHIHIAEGEADEIKAKMNFGMPIIAVLEKFGLLRKNSLLIHNSNITQDEIEILKKYDLFLVQAIDSNLNNAQNVANIHNFLQNGLKVTIGSDGMTSNILKLYKNSFLFTKYQNKNPDIGFEEMKKLFLNSFKLKTAYGFSIGLNENDTADFLITNYIPYTPFNESNFWGHFIYGITESKVTHLFSSGKLVLKNGEIADKGLIERISRSDNISKNLFEKFKSLT